MHYNKTIFSALQLYNYPIVFLIRTQYSLPMKQLFKFGICLFWYLFTPCLLCLKAQTILQPGDLAVISLGANVGGDQADCDTSGGGLASGRDLVSFICFQDIEPGTVIDITDNGWERRFSDFWGNVEGFLRVTRTGGTIPAGTIITIELPPSGTGYIAVAPDGDWMFESLGTNVLNFNSNGDQLFFMQGGVWNNGNTMGCCNGDQNATYLGGRILFGFNSKTTWNALLNSPQESALHPDVIPCFHMEPTGGTTNFIRYNGPTDEVSQLEWIDRISNASNWITFSDCAAFLANPLPLTSLPVGPNEIEFQCTVCSDCSDFTETLVAQLPNVGGPYEIKYTDGTDTFTLQNAVNGTEVNVDITKNTDFSILQITNNNGCPLYSNFGDPVSVQIVAPVEMVCSIIRKPNPGGDASGEASVEISAGNPPYEITWSSPSTNGSGILKEAGIFNITGLTPGDYSIVVMDANGCTSSCDLSLKPQDCSLTLSCEVLRDVSLVDGADGEAKITFSGGTPPYNVEWNGATEGTIVEDFDGSFIISILPSGNHNVIIQDKAGCLANCSFFIDEPDCSSFELKLTGMNPACDGTLNGSITAMTKGGNGNLFFNWNDDNLDNLSTPQGLGEGTYVVTVTDESRCRLQDSVTLVTPEALSAEIQAIPAGCNQERGSLIILEPQGGNPPYFYTLNGGNKTAIEQFPLEINSLSPGDYELIVEDSGNCAIAQSATIIESKQLELNLGEDLTIRVGDSITITPVINFSPQTAIWSPGTGLANPDSISTVAKPGSTINYELTVTDLSGCSISDQITIIVDKTRSVFVPTIFSPNNDGVNDYFGIFGGDDIIEIRDFHVFDRWGNLLFLAPELTLNDPRQGWDGTSKGQPVAPGTYIFFALVRYSGEDTDEIVEGSITLVR